MKKYGVWLLHAQAWYRKPDDGPVFADPARGVAEAEVRHWQIPYQIAVIGDDGLPVSDEG